MKLAFAGKGGSGKTTVSRTMTRQPARGGHWALAIDADSDPNFTLTLGIPAERMSDIPALPGNLLRRTAEGIELTQTLEQIRASHVVTGPDGVELLVMAHPQHANTGCLRQTHATVRTIIDAASSDEKDVCCAVPRERCSGEASVSSRMAVLAQDLGLARAALIANKVRPERDLKAVTAFAGKHGLEMGGSVPFDDLFAEAERAGVAPLDIRPDSPAIHAIATVARQWGTNGRA